MNQGHTAPHPMNPQRSASVLRTALPLCLAATLALAGCGSQVRNPVTGQLQRTVMNEQQEVATGSKNHEEIIKEYGVYPDQKVQAYVNEVGQRLAAQSHRANLQWHFTVLDSPEINAFALPGGYVYITRGIMAYLDSEADLAGVLGHEIGHVTARHGAQQATQRQNASLGVLAASVLGAVLEAKGVSGAGRVASSVSQNVAAGLIASYSREAESEADALGAEYLSRSHYNPANMVDVIRVLKAQETFATDQARAEGRKAPSGHNWLSSHPSNDKRLADIQQIAAKYPGPDQGRYLDDGKTRYLQSLSGLSFGDSPEQGLVRGQNFYHQGLGIAVTAPPGWRIVNSSTQLLLANSEGTAGLVIKPVPAKLTGSQEQVIRQVFNPVSGKMSATQINGMAATRFSGQGKNSQGQVQSINVTLVDGPKGTRYALLMAYRDANVLGLNLGDLVATEGSFRAMTAADAAAAQPWLIKLTPLPKGGFEQLASKSPLGKRAADHLRLLNGVYGLQGGPGSGDDHRPGQNVKIVATP